jgi:hypothetical protein
MRWFIFVLGSLATFRLSHLIAKERGPLAVFERLRNAMPGGRGSAKEWLSCIFCFSLTASALVCLILWCGGPNLSWEEWVLHWLGFSAVALIINQAFTFQK